jgi:uncharacterized protein YndB with AHSA1/START domain
MNKAIHGSFTIERIYDASPARVFKAFANPAAKARWFVGPDGWQEVERRLDFRLGGEEVAHGRFPNGVESRFVARYHEIVPDERIVYVYDMYAGGVFLSVSLATVELTAQGGRSALRITEQGVFFGQDGNDERRQGTEYLLAQVAANLPDEA